MTQPALRIAERPRRSPAREVQQDIHAFERKIDEALADGGTLLASMLRVGTMANVAAGSGQAALERTMEALDAGVTMRARILDVHDELRDIVSTLDLRELGFGALVDSPKTNAEPRGSVTPLQPAG